MQIGEERVPWTILASHWSSVLLPLALRRYDNDSCYVQNAADEEEVEHAVKI